MVKSSATQESLSRDEPTRRPAKNQLNRPHVYNSFKEILIFFFINSFYSNLSSLPSGLSPYLPSSSLHWVYIPKRPHSIFHFPPNFLDILTGLFPMRFYSSTSRNSGPTVFRALLTNLRSQFVDDL